VPLRAIGHLDKAEAFGLPGELIDDQLGADHVTKGCAQLGKLGFRDVVGETANEKFHAYPTLKTRVISKNFSGIGGYVIDSAGYQKRKCYVI
jgi:hypothetical protein